MADNPSKAWIGSLAVGLGTVVAMQWDNVLGALQRVPSLLTEWSTLPPENTSAVFAFVAAGVAWWIAFLHPRILVQKPQSGADVSAIAVAVLITMSRCLALSVKDPARVLDFFWYGLVAGALAAVLMRFGWSTWAPPKEPIP